MKVLITGGNGFFGSYINENLPAEYDRITIARKDLDLTNRTLVRQFLQQEKFDAVIHCAIQGRDIPRSTNPTLFYNNLSMFFNLADHSDLYGKFINFGCGAEFDIDDHCNHIQEQMIFQRYPAGSYAASKNIISRMCASLPNFFTLRVFGCFDSTEATHTRLPPLQHFINSLKYYDPDGWALESDRLFDWFSLHDVLVVVDAVLKDQIAHQDINLVYDQKYRISDFLRLYCAVHNLSADKLKINSQSEFNHTGDSSKLASYGLDLWGLERSLKEYGF